MITHLAIRNFQSIASADLDFGPYVSIIGPSDIGKSAVFRALLGLLENRNGESFVRHGAKSCSVAIDLDSGHRITWQKSRGISGSYTVTGPNGATATYEKTAGRVPDPVLALIRVSTEVGSDWLSPGIQRQHDAPFLLADTPRHRAEILGTFDGSAIALAAETVLRTGQRTAQAALKAAETQAVASRATLAAYDGLPAAHEAVAAAVAATEARDALAARVARLRALLQGVRLAQVRGEGYRARAAALTLPASMPSPDDLQALCERVQRGRQLVARARFMGAAAYADRQRAASVAAALDRLPPDDLEAALRRLEALRVAVAGVHYHQRQAEAARAVLAGPVPPPVAEVDALLAVGQRLARLRALVGQALEADARATTHAREVVRWAAEEAAARADLAALAGETCPECLQPLTVEALA